MLHTIAQMMKFTIEDSYICLRNFHKAIKTCLVFNRLKESYDEHQKLMKDLHNERKKRPSDAVSR